MGLYASLLFIAGAAFPPALFLCWSAWNALHPLQPGLAACGMPALGAMCATPIASITFGVCGYQVGKFWDSQRR